MHQCAIQTLYQNPFARGAIASGSGRRLDCNASTTCNMRVSSLTLDTVQGESARRAITGAEFFNRYPSLHPFLLAQLQAAAQQLSQGSSAVHPSLVPILALVSRLRLLCCAVLCCADPSRALLCCNSQADLAYRNTGNSSNKDHLLCGSVQPKDNILI